MVLFKWIYLNIESKDNVEKINSKFELSSFTYCYWAIISLFIGLIVYILVVNKNKICKLKLYNYLFYK